MGGGSERESARLGAGGKTKCKHSMSNEIMTEIQKDEAGRAPSFQGATGVCRSAGAESIRRLS